MRYKSEFPKIGIRPTIDARANGVRESLEDQTMNMAKNLAAFLQENIKYIDGSSLKCIIADSTIGRVSEAAECANKFKKEGVEITITVTPCWCYGSETMDVDPMSIKAVWGFNGTERPGAVYLAAVLAGHTQKGLPAFAIYGREVQDATDTSIPEDVKEKVLRFARAAVAAKTMQGKSYLSIGGVSMGIAGSIVDQNFFQHYLGMRNESIDMSELIRRIDQNIYDKEEYEKALSWTKKNCKEGKDNNKNQHTREQKDKAWEISVKCALIVQDLMTGNPKLESLGFSEEAKGHNAIAAGFQGQRQWTDFMPNGDFMEAILNSSFDWNGKRAPYILATENDSLNAVSMLFLHLLTNTSVMFSDVRTYWSASAIKRVSNWEPVKETKNGLIHLINSGASALDASARARVNNEPAMKPFWELKDEEVKACLDATKWRYASLEYFRGGGYSSNFLTDGGMPCTMIRINMVSNLGPVIQIVEGYSVELPKEVNKILDERTDPTWPTTWFAPRLTGKGPFTDVYSVMANWGANHGAIVYSHIGLDVITLASMLRIPVCMHNVDEDKIYRPSYFSAFGSDKEGQDYRACQALGPMYK